MRINSPFIETIFFVGSPSSLSDTLSGKYKGPILPHEVCSTLKMIIINKALIRREAIAILSLTFLKPHYPIYAIKK